MNNLIHKFMKDFAGIIPDEELKYIYSNLESFFNAIGPEGEPIANSFEVAQIKKNLFLYEKKYLPLLEQNIKVSEKLKPDNLFLTVGLQPEPLILSILCLKPQRVYLLHSEESRQNANEIVNDLDIKKLNCEFRFAEITEYDASRNYEIIKEILNSLPKQSKTVFDPTGGRKIMVSSVSLAAFYYRFPMVYMHGKDIKGKTVPFSERLRIIENPLESYGDIELQLVEELFNSHFYEAAAKTCDNLLKSTKDLATSRKIELLKDLISVYSDWDAFNHSKYFENNQRERPLLSERLKSVVDDFEKFNLQNNLPENVENNIVFLKELDKSFRNSLNIVDEYRIVDIYLNALRKGTDKQAKYDDGIARLYRCVEMCFTYRLEKDLWIVNVSHPDYNKLCEKTGISISELQDRFKKASGRDLRLGEPLGLDNQVNLLKSFFPDDEMVKIYESMKEKEIKMRNRSILAHGTRPSTEEDWRTFKNKTIQIIKLAIGEDKFEELGKEKTGLGWHGKISLK